MLNKLKQGELASVQGFDAELFAKALHEAKLEQDRNHRGKHIREEYQIQKTFHQRSPIRSNIGGTGMVSRPTNTYKDTTTKTNEAGDSSADEMENITNSYIATLSKHWRKKKKGPGLMSLK